MAVCSSNLRCQYAAVDSTILVTNDKVSSSNLCTCGDNQSSPLGESYGGQKMAMVLADMTIQAGNFFCVQVI